jgi:hypothetical protein
MRLSTLAAAQRARCATGLHDYRLRPVRRVPVGHATNFRADASTVRFEHRCSGCNKPSPC